MRGREKYHKSNIICGPTPTEDFVIGCRENFSEGLIVHPWIFPGSRDDLLKSLVPSIVRVIHWLVSVGRVFEDISSSICVNLNRSA